MIEVQAVDVKPKKKKLPALDKYVILCLVVVILYDITAIVYQFITKEEISPTLTTCLHAGFVGELFMLCMIKRLKLKGGTDHDD